MKEPTERLGPRLLMGLSCYLLIASAMQAQMPSVALFTGVAKARSNAVHPPPFSPDAGNNDQRGGGPASCDCWVTPTSSYHTIVNGSEWNAAGFNDLDDGSYGPSTLQFPFCLYGAQSASSGINHDLRGPVTVMH